MTKKYRIALVIVLVGFTLMCLIGVQVYWVNNAYSLSEKEFSANVKGALQKTVEEINRSLICFELFTKVHINPHEGFYLLKNKWINNQNERVFSDRQAPDTIPMYYNEPRFDLNFRYSNMMFTRHVNISMVLQFQYTSDGTDTFYVYANDFEKATIENYQETLSEGKTIEEYYNPALFDSLLKKNLAFYSINEAYNFAYIDTRKDKVMYSTDAYTTALLNSSFRVRLTPTEYFSRVHDVSLVFDNYKAHLFSTFRNLLILSIAVVLIFTFCFFFFVQMVLRQRHLNELKTDFINNMTHEFKTPLTNISLAVETITVQNMIRDEKGEKIIRIVGLESERLRENIERILQIARYEKEKIHLFPDKIDLHQLIKKVVAVFEPLFPNGEVVFRCSFNATKYILEVDEMHFFNMLYNIIDNAIKYNSGNPKIDISTYNHGNAFSISIKDNGIGIASRNQKNIFEKFFRVQQGNLHDVKGYGLGLSYVKLVVEAHGGNIKVNSVLGQGTEFEITIPITL